jgi:hypothetical protein
MNNKPILRVHWLGACVRTAFLLALAGWSAFLFFQHGQIWDEGEHAHAAWLVSQGKVPLDEFFQHHQPLLWSVLALYYRAGLRGAGVLIWGRILVVLSGLACAVALLRIARPADGTPSRLSRGLGPAAFIAMTLLLPRLFVIRPETISAALLLVALCVWMAGSSFRSEILKAVLAGMLAGAAVYSSPRFALLGGLFLLFGRQSCRRWLALTLGGAAFVAAYTVVSGFSLSKVIFDIRFSAFLQSVGIWPVGRPVEFWYSFSAVACVPLLALVLAVDRKERLRCAVLIAYAVAVFVICARVAGLFEYPEAYAPFITAVAVTYAWVGARLQWPPDGLGTYGLIAAPVLFAAALALPYMEVQIPPFDFLATVRYRERLAAAVPPGATVLLYSRDSPITVPDASYYGTPLVDGQNRLCRAVREFNSQRKLPPCNFMKVLLDARPYLTEAGIGVVTRGADRQRADRYVRAHYHRVPALDGPPDPPTTRKWQAVMVRGSDPR